MSTTNMTPEDLLLSLTGFDELAVAKSFGSDVGALRNQPFMFMRVLVFVDLRRKGSKDGVAHHEAMSMPIGVLQDYFAKSSEEEELPDESESGKGD